MRINRRSLLSIFTIIAVSMFAAVVTLITSSPIIHVIGLWSIAFCAVIISGFDLLHPYFWFSSFFVLYSSAYTIILTQGFQTNTGYTYENTLISIIALTVSLIIIGPKKTQIVAEFENVENYEYEINRKLLTFILISLVIILIISVVLITRLGILRKSEFVSNRYTSFRIATYTVRYITFFCSMYIINSRKRSPISLLVLLSGLSILFFSLFTAERDGIFRFLLVTICALYASNRISKKKLPVILGLGILSVVAVSYLKYFFVSGQVRAGYLDNSIIYNFLNSDFAAAGENMQVLINNPWTKSYKSFLLIFRDIISPFTFGDNSFNIGVWFNDTFYFGKSSRAFTLIGQGYVLGGYFGIIVLFTTLGIIIRAIYNQAKNNPNILSMYIFSIATISSSFRGTLGGIIATFVRIAVVGILGFIVVRMLLVKRVSRRLNKTKKKNSVYTNRKCNYFGEGN